MIALDEAVAALRRGEVVAFPTESSYGLAVDARSLSALEKLFAVKGRPDSKPPPILVDGEAMARTLVVAISPTALRLIAQHWPGALTLALPALPSLPPPIVSEGFVAVRWSPHPIANALVAAFGAPITATSANLSGQPPAHDAKSAALPGVAAVVDGGPTKGAPPSTLVRVHDDGRLEILRPGPVVIDRS